MISTHAPFDHAWEPLETVPVTIGERHWLDCLDGIADDEHLRPWLDEPRFRQRLIARLRTRHHLPPATELPPLTEADRRLCRLGTEEIAACVRAAGVIVHAAAFTQAIQASQVSALRACFGNDLHTLALHHRDQPRPDVRETPRATDIEALEVAVERDGRRCLKAWYHAQPLAWRAWLALGWPAALATDETGDASETPHANDAAIAIARLAGEVPSKLPATEARPDANHDEETP